jgi:hypothetical protein
LLQQQQHQQQRMAVMAASELEAQQRPEKHYLTIALNGKIFINLMIFDVHMFLNTVCGII